MKYTSIEDCASLLRAGIAKHFPGSSLQITCNSGNKDKYYRFVALTQRILKNETIVGYVTYRTKLPKKTTDVVFSSYEIFDASFKSLCKIHIEPDPKEALKEAFEKIGSIVK